MIYFIKQNKISPIRIGFANNVEERLQELQAGSSNKLICLKNIQTEDDQKIRQVLFDFFSTSKIEKSSWFALTQVLANFLDSLTDTQSYSITQINYLLDLALKSVNTFKIKININQIRSCMKSLHYNQSTLAEKIGLSRQAISFMFSRKQTSLFTAEGIAHALNCTLKEITF